MCSVRSPEAAPTSTAFRDKLVQDVARHLDVVARNAERRDDVLLGVAFLHEPRDVLQVDVLVRHVRVVVVGGTAASRTARGGHCCRDGAAVQVVVVGTAGGAAACSVALFEGGEVDVFVEEGVGGGSGGGDGGQGGRQLGRGDGFGGGFGVQGGVVGREGLVPLVLVRGLAGGGGGLLLVLVSGLGLGLLWGVVMLGRWWRLVDDGLKYGGHFVREDPVEGGRFELVDVAGAGQD